MMKYSLIEMKKHNYGRILLIASISGKEVRNILFNIAEVLMFKAQYVTYSATCWWGNIGCVKLPKLFHSKIISALKCNGTLYPKIFPSNG